MPTLLFHSPADSAGWWRDVLSEAMPELGFRAWPDTGDAGAIDYALVWKPKPGLLASLPNLRAILSLGAGVDHIFADPHLPAGVPICRVVDDNMTMRMREWVLLQVLMHHRQQRAYDEQQRNRIWKDRPQPHAGERRVGVMGLGVLGGDAARQLKAVGFDVAGWSRTPRRIEGVTCYHGQDGLHAFLARTEILVSLLPLTPETTGILDADAFARMPRGASIINAGRGGQVVETDLLAALDSAQLSEATLDVFATEPLPQESRLWSHPRVTVTPHVAASTDPRSVVHQVVANIRRIEAGEAPLNTVDPARGY
ncbi:MAG: glyoxylate/hydroxypyruvate reductase A [Pseudomonadota bacterium]|nr:glyoxylate/hydroxypyruvate reductase A [Pseudomonadota bacterium]